MSGLSKPVINDEVSAGAPLAEGAAMPTSSVRILAATSFLLGCGAAQSVSVPTLPVVTVAGDGGVDGGNSHADGGSDAGSVPLALSFVVHTDAGTRAVDSLVYSLPFSIRLVGAAPNASVKLTTRLQRLSASALFVASADGVVDTATDAPRSGSYSGVDADGLIWSMTTSTSSFSNSYDVGVQAEVDGVMLTARLARPGMGTGTTIGDVMAGQLPGEFYQFPGPERRPAVLVLGGSECTLSVTSFMAAWITTAGYHALALDYCQQGIIERVPLEHLSLALDWLASQPGVDPDRLAVMGASRGGELALEIAARERRLRGTVALVPSPWRWGGTGPNDLTAWTVAGVDLPTIPSSATAMGRVEMLPGLGQGLRLTPLFEATLAAATPMQRAAAAIEVGSATSSMLLIGAGDDGIWPSCQFVEAAWTMLGATNHQATHPLSRRLCLANAGHSMGPPGWASSGGYASFNQQLGTSLVYGGTVEGRGRANRAVDTAIREFLHAAFGR